MRSDMTNVRVEKSGERPSRFFERYLTAQRFLAVMQTYAYMGKCRVVLLEEELSITFV
jgi:hypothetical protein